MAIPIPFEKAETYMARRAVLCDANNVEIAHVPFREMDDYIERGLVERLTPVKASTHVFRLLINTTAPVYPRFSPASLTEETNRANAGVVDDIRQALWARRKVKAWPKIGDTRAPRVSIKLVTPRKHRSGGHNVSR